jgi:hypothetical protein
MNGLSILPPPHCSNFATGGVIGFGELIPR